MKSDLEILEKIKEELTKVAPSSFDPSIIELYGKLADRVPEDGFELLVADKDLSEVEEMALRLLNRWEYVTFEQKHHAGDGYYYHIDMCGKRFFEMADSNIGMQDSGKRETFATGAVRDSAEGKSRPDLFSPFALERVGEWLRLGSLKYAENNWMKGMNYSRVVASLHRHLMKYMQRDDTEDNLAAIIVNASFLMHYDAMIERGVLPKSLNDLQTFDLMRVHRNGDEILET